MSKLWVLIGQGANELEIPAMIWTNHDSALAACVQLLGNKYKTGEKNGSAFHVWEGNRKWNCGTGDEDMLEDPDPDYPTVVCPIYTTYYGGCGECYRATLREVDEGKPFVGWDLD